VNFWGIFKAFEQGVLSLPETFWHGIERTGQDIGLEGITSFEEAWGQNWRLMVLLEKTVKYGVMGAKHSPLIEAMIIILERYYHSLPQKEKKEVDSKLQKVVARKLGKLTAGTLFSIGVAKRISNKIIVDSFLRGLAKNLVKGVGTILSIQGIIYTSAQASQRLKYKYPKIYFKMKEKDLDMLYFLLEKPMQKYLRAIKKNGRKLIN
jgi:hypothetical protein